MPSPTWRTKTSYNGKCDGCGRGFFAANAMGAAAQHFARGCGPIYLDQHITFVWDAAGHPKDREQRQEAADGR
jgi:hypothetical protein